MSSDTDSEPEREPESAPCCEWLLDPWLARAREDAAREAAEGDACWPPITLPPVARGAVWRLCRMMGARGEATPPLTARLLERYLAADARYTLSTLAVVARYSSKGLDELRAASRRRDLARLPLAMVTCVQLAGKMCGAGGALGGERARRVLAALRREHSLAEINAAEHAAFARLGHRVPLWGTLEMAEVLATRVGVLATRRKPIAACVRLAELCRGEVERRVRAAGGFADARGPAVTSLLLAAAAVGAGVRLSGGGGGAGELLRRLAAAASAPRDLVRCVLDVIVTLALEDSAERK